MSQPLPETVLLERVKYMMGQSVNRRVWEDVKVATSVDWLAGDLLLRFEKIMLAEEVLSSEVDVPVPVPKTWWQHLKRDHFPGWYLDRWPVRLTDRWIHIDLAALAVFPEANIKTPPSMRGDRFYQYYRGDWEVT